ncbi:hypothetical protein FAI41_06030 [Acetobacteraceae bacterium]|nr:hypothetical protein FAI41_06030 [Acetobacteraceae bacterium]
MVHLTLSFRGTLGLCLIGMILAPFSMCRVWAEDADFKDSPTYQKFFGSGVKQKQTPSNFSNLPQKQNPQPKGQRPLSDTSASSEQIEVEGLSHNAQNVIGKADISHFVEGTDPLQVLADSTPGASYTDGQLRMRGFREDQLGFTMDGIPLDGPPPIIPENVAGN